MNRIYAETLLSNQPSWLNFSNSTYSSTGLEVSTTLPLPVSTLFSKYREILFDHIDDQAHCFRFYTCRKPLGPGF